MPHRRSRVKGYTAANWKPACNALRDAIRTAENDPALTSLETAMWNAAQTAVDSLMAAVSTAPPLGGAWFEIDIDISSDPQVRSIVVNVTYRN